MRQDFPLIPVIGLFVGVACILLSSPSPWQPELRIIPLCWVLRLFPLGSRSYMRDHFSS